MKPTTSGPTESNYDWRNRIGFNHERDRELVDFINSLESKPNQRVFDMLRNSSTVSSRSLIKLMQLPLWPVIHERIYNPSATDVFIDICILDNN